MKLFIQVLFLLLPTIAFSQDTFKVFYLGGQSNMDGYGYTKDLPESLTKTLKNAWIFHGNPAPDGAYDGGIGIWAPLIQGHGVGFSSDGKLNNLSERFGIELSFAKKLVELYPNEKIAIIKYSRGGTSIDSLAAGQFGSWEPDFKSKGGINQYDHFLATVRHAQNIRDLNGDGKDDILIPAAILWMQGESDAAYTEEIANRYYGHLKRLMDLIRASFLTDDMPVLIGKISDSWNNEEGKVWKYGELVQYAEEKYARTDGNASIVRSTRYYKYSDPWHYNSDGYIDFGIRFAEAYHTLIK